MATVTRKYGRRVPPPLPPHRMLTLSPVPSLPPVVDLRPSCGPVKDQGSEGCHDDKTEVLTEHGWKFWPEYDGSSLLGTMNQLSGALEFQRPSDFHVFDHNGPMVMLNRRSLDFCVTPNHRMYVRKWNEGKRTLEPTFAMTRADSLGWYCGLPHATSGWAGTDIRRIRVGRQEYNADDFIALVSLVVSDGWVGGTDSNKGAVSFASFKEDRREMVSSLASRIGFSELPSRPGVWKHQDPELAEWFRQNAYINDNYGASTKKVPDIVKVASMPLIHTFFKFYGDQYDGHVWELYSCSPRLIDDLQELALRIGQRSSITKRGIRDASTMADGRMIQGRHPSYELIIRRKTQLSIERKNDELHTSDYQGNVFCATVPNSTLVTRRNGTVLISGNSCTAHAGTSAREWINRAYLHRSGIFQFSPAYTYAKELLAQGNFPEDSGSDGVTLCGTMVTDGCCELSLSPYAAGQISKPTLEQDANARLHTLGAFHGLQGSSTALSVLGDPTPWPLLIGFTVPPLFESSEVATSGYLPEAGGSIGGHEVLGVGYDITEDGDNRRIRPVGCPPAFLIQNSWGAGWGLSGFFWMPITYLDREDTDIKIAHSGQPWKTA